MSKKSMVAMAAALFCVSTAHAEMVTLTSGLPLVAKPGATDTLTFNLFDASQGTLTGATMEFSRLLDISLGYDNPGNAGARLSFRYSFNFDTDFSIDALDPEAPSFAGFLQVVDALDAGESHTERFGGIPITQTLDFGPYLASLIGTGSFTMTCSRASTFDNTSDPAITFDITEKSGCGATLVYTYVPGETKRTVPEPATLVLAGLALAGAGFASRRRAG